MSTHETSAAESRKRKWKQSLPSVNNVNSGLFDDLQILINGVDLVHEGVSNDYRPVAEFVHKGLGVQCTQGWSYYAQVNEHTKFAETTVKLTKLIAILSSDPSVHSYGAIIIRDILNNYCKVLYRGINNLRPNITNSVFRLMTEIVQFNNGQFVDEFLSYFDLTLPSFLKILAPRKMENIDVEATKKSTHVSMRASFIKFWITLLKCAPAILRKDIMIDNQKIMTAWVKNIVKMDPPTSVQEAVRLFIDFVLKETTFKKMTKCKILNEFVVSRLHELYYSTNNTLLALADEFFQVYCSGNEDGIIFPEKNSWFEDNSTLRSGASIMVNKKEFKLRNKLLYTTITFFKPWEDDSQCKIVIQALQNAPELVAPYSTYLSSMGSHDPKMTAYWFGMTLFLGRLMNLPIPDFVLEVESDVIPSTNIIIESIIPSLITKSALTKSLEYDVNIIKQMGCQLILFSFKKLEAVLTVYTNKGWDDSKALLLNSFFSVLPELSVFAHVLNTTYANTPDNKILSLSLTVLCSYYSRIFPNFFSLALPSSNIYVDIMKSVAFSGIDLVILDNFLKFQEFNNSQIKWWHAAKGEHSLFTSLCRLAASKSSSTSVALRVSRLLDNLLKFGIIYNVEKLIGSPVSALINSLAALERIHDNSTDEVLEKVLKLLDETISRCYKTPYKYVDLANEYQNISPFLIALFEQWKFVTVDNPDESPLVRWLLILSRNMMVLGESEDGVLRALSNIDNVPADLIGFYLSFNDESLSALRALDNNLLTSNNSDSTFDHILLQSSSNLSNVTRFPVSPFDVSAVSFRIRYLFFIDQVPRNVYEIVTNLLAMIGNYALGDPRFKTFASSKTFFMKLIDHDIESLSEAHFDLLFYLINGLQQVYSQLEVEYDDFKKAAQKLFTSVIGLSKTFKKDAALEVLSQIVLVQDLPACLIQIEGNFDIVRALLLKRCLENDVGMNGKLFLTILKDCDTRSQSILRELVQAKLIKCDNASDLVPALLDSEPFLLESCIKNMDILPEVMRRFNTIQNETAKLVIAAYLEQLEYPSEVKEAVAIAQGGLGSFSGYGLFIALKLLSKHTSLLTNEAIEEVSQFVTKHKEVKYTSEAVSFFMDLHSRKQFHQKVWLNKLFLFITKYMAENTTMSDAFISLLDTTKTFLMKLDSSAWKLVKPSILNAQMEVAFSNTWCKSNEVLEFINIMLLCSQKTQVNSNQLLHLLLNNESLSLLDEKGSGYSKLLTTYIVHQLFYLNVSENSSTTLQDKVLEFYRGSMAISDRLLLDVLTAIESQTGQAWTTGVVSWEFIGSLADNELELIGPLKLITKEKEGLVVTISKDVITNTLNNFPIDPCVLGVDKAGSVEQKWISLKNMHFKQQGLFNGESSLIYDPMFIMLCSLNSEEFVRFSADSESKSVVYNVKSFIDSGLLQLAIASLSSDPATVSISKSIIEGILYSTQNQSLFKDSRVFEVLLSKILFTLTHRSSIDTTEGLLEIPPLIWIAISRVCDILLQPSSDLYEKAYRWVLSTPFIRNNDIPLLKTVLFTDKDSFTDSENYYKYLSWVLLTLKLGTRTPKDVKLLRVTNCIEWLNNLHNSPYLHIRLKTLNQEIFYAFQSIDNGERLLISGYGAIALADTERQILSKRLTETVATWSKNEKNTKTLKEMIVEKQQLVNNIELSTRRIIIASTDKRILDWMDHDELNAAKRVCR